jgi:hypothetical protein
LILDGDSKIVARIVLNGPPAELAPGLYLVKLIGTDDLPLLVEIKKDTPQIITLTKEGGLTVVQP